MRRGLCVRVLSIAGATYVTVGSRRPWYYPFPSLTGVVLFAVTLVGLYLVMEERRVFFQDFFCALSFVMLVTCRWCCCCCGCSRRSSTAVGSDKRFWCSYSGHFRYSGYRHKEDRRLYLVEASCCVSCSLVAVKLMYEIKNDLLRSHRR